MGQQEERWTTGSLVAVIGLFAIPFVITGGIFVSMIEDQRVKDLLVGVLGFIAAVAVLVWAVSAGVRSGLAKRERDVLGAEPQVSTANRSGGFPVQSAPVICYIVVGVRRDTQEDVSLQIEATTPANARAKAELQNVVVTEVRAITA